MQLEYILQAHGLTGRNLDNSTPLPEITNFTAVSKNDGSGIDLSWVNSILPEYVKTVIFSSEVNISNTDYDYCIANATKIVDSNSIVTYADTSHIRGSTVYYRGFMIFSTFGETKNNNGVGLSCVVLDAVPPNTITNFAASTADGTINLSWVNPTDSDFVKAKILMKTGSYPTSPTDGTVIYEGSGIFKSIIGLTNGSVYYFRCFTYDTSGNINSLAENQQITVTHSAQKIYGVRVDTTNSNPETSVTYIGDSIGFTPMSGNNGSFLWGSWESIFNGFEIKPCLLKAGVVQYYLNPNNFAQKVDGVTASDITTGNDGDVMIEFGKPIWTKWTDEGSTYTIQISDKTFTGAVKTAFEMENGYNLFPYYPLFLTQQLFLVFFKHQNSQIALGRGRVDGTGYINSGGTDAKGMFWGSTADLQMKFLGIEDYWGNKLQWIDGIVTDASRNLLIGKSGLNDTGSGYTSFSSGLVANLGGYINSVQGGNDKGFIIKTGAGSDSTYLCDYGYLASSRVPYFGGYCSDGSAAGFASLRLNSSVGGTFAYIGSRLFCASTNKMYVGVYLGFNSSSKLRSLSNTMATATQTIGTFRAQAKANN